MMHTALQEEDVIPSKMPRLSRGHSPNRMYQMEPQDSPTSSKMSTASRGESPQITSNTPSIDLQEISGLESGNKLRSQSWSSQSDREGSNVTAASYGSQNNSPTVNTPNKSPDGRNSLKDILSTKATVSNSRSGNLAHQAHYFQPLPARSSLLPAASKVVKPVPIMPATYTPAYYGNPNALFTVSRIGNDTGATTSAYAPHPQHAQMQGFYGVGNINSTHPNPTTRSISLASSDYLLSLNLSAPNSVVKDLFSHAQVVDYIMAKYGQLISSWSLRSQIETRRKLENSVEICNLVLLEKLRIKDLRGLYLKELGHLRELVSLKDPKYKGLLWWVLDKEVEWHMTAPGLKGIPVKTLQYLKDAYDADENLRIMLDEALEIINARNSLLGVFKQGLSTRVKRFSPEQLYNSIMNRFKGKVELVKYLREKNCFDSRYAKALQCVQCEECNEQSEIMRCYMDLSLFVSIARSTMSEGFFASASRETHLRLINKIKQNQYIPNFTVFDFDCYGDGKQVSTIEALNVLIRPGLVPAEELLNAPDDNLDAFFRRLNTHTLHLLISGKMTYKQMFTTDEYKHNSIINSGILQCQGVFYDTLIRLHDDTLEDVLSAVCRPRDNDEFDIIEMINRGSISIYEACRFKKATLGLIGGNGTASRNFRSIIRDQKIKMESLIMFSEDDIREIRRRLENHFVCKYFSNSPSVMAWIIDLRPDEFNLVLNNLRVLRSPLLKDIAERKDVLVRRLISLKTPREISCLEMLFMHVEKNSNMRNVVIDRFCDGTITACSITKIAPTLNNDQTNFFWGYCIKNNKWTGDNATIIGLATETKRIYKYKTIPSEGNSAKGCMLTDREISNIRSRSLFEELYQYLPDNSAPAPAPAPAPVPSYIPIIDMAGRKTPPRQSFYSSEMTGRITPQQTKQQTRQHVPSTYVDYPSCDKGILNLSMVKNALSTNPHQKTGERTSVDSLHTSHQQESPTIRYTPMSTPRSTPETSVYDAISDDDGVATDVRIGNAFINS